MLCVRCTGLVISDQYLGTDGKLPIRRCLNCGAVSESIMDVHRSRQLQSKRKEPRQPYGPASGQSGPSIPHTILIFP
jgi:hypothetical protein